MAKHLPGKVARAISDFWTIGDLITMIEHEMEKRIVARHALVKLDSILNLTARLKNDVRGALPAKKKKETIVLEQLLARLRADLDKSQLEIGRDAFAAHSLQLDLKRIVDTWMFMGETTFGVLKSDLNDIDKELRRLSSENPQIFHYPGATLFSILPEWRKFWRDEANLGDPNRPRLANIYPGLGTAGIVSALPGGHPAQDATIRAVGLAIFLRQIRILLQAVSRGSEVERLFAEIMVNDYFSLWELLFISGVQNEHGQVDLCVLDHWSSESFKGSPCLAAVQTQRHPDFEKWRLEVRNKVTAHVDPDADVWVADLKHWPLTVDQLINEALRLIESCRECASHDIRTKIFFTPPCYIGGKEIVGLSGQEGRYWKDA